METIPGPIQEQLKRNTETLNSVSKSHKDLEAYVENETQQQRQRLDDLDVLSKELETQTAALSTGIENKADKTSLEAVQASVSSVKKTSDMAIESFQQLEGKSGELEKQIATVSEKNAVIAAEVQTVRASVADIHAEIQQEISKLTEQQTILEQTIKGDIIKQIEELKITFDQKMKELNEKVEKVVEEKIKAIMQQIEALAGELNQLKRTIDGIKEELIATQERVKQVESEIKEIDGELKAIRGEMKNMEGRLLDVITEKIAEETEKAKAELMTLHKQKLEEAVSSLTTYIDKQIPAALEAQQRSKFAELQKMMEESEKEVEREMEAVRTKHLERQKVMRESLTQLIGSGVAPASSFATPSPSSHPSGSGGSDPKVLEELKRLQQMVTELRTDLRDKEGVIEQLQTVSEEQEQKSQKLQKEINILKGGKSPAVSSSPAPQAASSSAPAASSSSSAHPAPSGSHAAPSGPSASPSGSKTEAGSPNDIDLNSTLITGEGHKRAKINQQASFILLFYSNQGTVFKISVNDLSFEIDGPSKPNVLFQFPSSHFVFFSFLFFSFLFFNSRPNFVGLIRPQFLIDQARAQGRWICFRFIHPQQGRSLLFKCPI